MVGDTWNRRTKGLRQAAHLAGGQEPLAKLMRLDRSTLNKLINHPEKETDHRNLILAEKHTGVDLEHLSDDKEINDYLRERGHKLMLRSVSKQDILIKGTPSLPYCKPNHHIIIDTERRLISGLMKLSQVPEADKVKVVVVDLEAFLFDPKAKINLPPGCLIHSEYFAIGLHLEHLFGGKERQGQRNDLLRRKLKNKDEKTSQLLPTWGEVKGRKDIKIAKFLGYSTNTYYRGKKVYSCGIPELIDAMDDKILPIGVAAKIAHLPKEQQMEYLQSQRKQDKELLRVHSVEVEERVL